MADGHAQNRTAAVAPPRLDDAVWLNRDELQSVFAMLHEGGYEGRAVGGAVRNALIGKPVDEVDVATNAPPDEVVRLAKLRGLKTVPTGLQHGTVTVVAHPFAYEVTTLREDVETFGRHATIAFTADWAADAQRRDFTINALYCSADGTVHDPLGGYADLQARRVRFIGDARQRIREDFLRVLRFFRFFAEYAGGDPDAASLHACMQERRGLAHLSGERLRQELLKLVIAPRAIDAVDTMTAHGLATEILPVAPRPTVFARLVALEQALDLTPNAALRLAALTVAVEEDGVRLSERLRLSRDERDVLLRAGRQGADSILELSERDAKVLLYKLGPRVFVERVLLAWAGRGDPAESAALTALVTLPRRWPVPSMPMGGRDIVAMGIAPGRKVGEIMRAVEEWWIAQGFPSDQHIVLAEAKRLAGETIPD